MTDQEGMLSEVIAVNMPTVSKFWSAVTGSLTRTIVNLDSTRCKILEHIGIKFCHSVTNLVTSYCKKTHRLEGGLLVESTMEI